MISLCELRRIWYQNHLQRLKDNRYSLVSIFILSYFFFSFLKYMSARKKYIKASLIYEPTHTYYINKTTWHPMSPSYIHVHTHWRTALCMQWQRRQQSNIAFFLSRYQQLHVSLSPLILEFEKCSYNFFFWRNFNHTYPCIFLGKKYAQLRDVYHNTGRDVFKK